MNTAEFSGQETVMTLGCSLCDPCTESLLPSIIDFALTLPSSEVHWFKIFVIYKYCTMTMGI